MLFLQKLDSINNKSKDKFNLLYLTLLCTSSLSTHSKDILIQLLIPNHPSYSS